MTEFLIGFGLSTIVALLAYQKKGLNEGGVITAIIIGTILFVYGGWFAFVFLVVFFGSASLLNLLSKEKPPAHRNTIQVLANGGFAAVFSIGYYITQVDLYYTLIFLSVAVSASDTWSSEVGVLSKHNPRDILTFKTVPTGLSGGITLIGFAASLAASILFGVLSYIALTDWTLVLMIIGFAFLGSVIDSLLGTIQIKYINDAGFVTEIKAKEFSRYSGFPWLTNDLVNFLSNGLTLGLFIALLTLIT